MTPARNPRRSRTNVIPREPINECHPEGAYPPVILREPMRPKDLLRHAHLCRKQVDVEDRFFKSRDSFQNDTLRAMFAVRSCPTDRRRL